MDDLYEVLELGRNASGEEIKANYRRLAMRWHPDRNGGSPQAEERFKRVSEAYSVLSDPQARRAYDAGRAPGLESGSGFAGFGAFTRERAASMFMSEMFDLAIELTMQNVGWRDIAAQLERRGCPEAAAAEIARDMELRRKAMIRGNARPYFRRSAVSGLLGLAMLTLFGGVGLGLFGLFGLVLFLSGAYNLLRALYFMTTGNAPRSLG